jgi:hypothetical protein
LHVFTAIQFGSGRWDRYCPECRTIADRRAAIADLLRGRTISSGGGES